MTLFEYSATDPIPSPSPKEPKEAMRPILLEGTALSSDESPSWNEAHKCRS